MKKEQGRERDGDDSGDGMGGGYTAKKTILLE